MVLTNSQIVTDYIHNSYIKDTLDEYSKDWIKLSKDNSTLVYNSSDERDGLTSFEY